MGYTNWLNLSHVSFRKEKAFYFLHLYNNPNHINYTHDEDTGTGVEENNPADNILDPGFWGTPFR